MITINILQINTKTNTLDISVETSQGHIINSAKLWTEDTFKDYTQSISLDGYLQQTTNLEVFSVPISTLSKVDSTGLYFVEFTTTDNDNDECSECNDKQILGVTADLSSYQECLLDSLLEIKYETSDVTNNLDSGEALAISSLLEAICISVKFGYYQEAVDILTDIKILCANKQACNSCHGLPTPVFKTGLNFTTLNNNLILQ